MEYCRDSQGSCLTSPCTNRCCYTVEHSGFHWTCSLASLRFSDSADLNTLHISLDDLQYLDLFQKIQSTWIISMYLVGSPVHTWKAGTVTISSVSKPPTQQSQRESLPVRKTLFLYHLNFKPSKWHLVFMTYCMWVISTLMLLLNTTWFIMPKEPQWQITAVCKITEIFTNTVFFFFFFFF